MKTYASLRRLAFALAVTSAALAGKVSAETWQIDPAHSSVGFNVRHFISKVPGTFAQFEGTIRFDPKNPTASSAEATLKTTSVTTNNAKRDSHLNTGDFFLTEKFPTITFKSTEWKKTGDDTFDVTGNLTIKDVTKPVTLKTKLIGIGPGQGGKTLSGWEATGKVDRRDFGITYGQGVVGNEVDIVINVEAAKQ